VVRESEPLHVHIDTLWNTFRGEKAQYNFTDPESRILKGSDGFVQGYNTQIAVEPVFQLIVGQRVTQVANDKQQMVPLIEAMEAQRVLLG